MIIEILHNRECRAWQECHADSKNWLRAWGLPRKAKIKILLIENDEHAKERKFFGSPQLVIDGDDVDAAALSNKKYHSEGCRLYSWNNKVYDYPPREMVEEVILRTVKGKNK